MTPTLERELMTHRSTLHLEFLFANPKTRRPITDIKHGFDGACEEAGIREFWFHDLRHTAATRMAERGIDPFTIAAIMGRADIKMTASYTHATTSARRAAVAALEKASLESGHASLEGRLPQLESPRAGLESEQASFVVLKVANLRVSTQISRVGKPVFRIGRKWATKQSSDR